MQYVMLRESPKPASAEQMIPIIPSLSLSCADGACLSFRMAHGSSGSLERMGKQKRRSEWAVQRVKAWRAVRDGDRNSQQRAAPT
jgi:hypothetical protein